MNRPKQICTSMYKASKNAIVHTSRNHVCGHAYRRDLQGLCSQSSAPEEVLALRRATGVRREEVAGRSNTFIVTMKVRCAHESLWNAPTSGRHQPRRRPERCVRTPRSIQRPFRHDSTPHDPLSLPPIVLPKTGTLPKKRWI